MSAEERLNKAACIVKEMRGKVNEIFAEYVPMLREMLPEMLNGYGRGAMDIGISICDRGLHVDPRDCPNEYPQTSIAAEEQGWELEDPEDIYEYEHWHKDVNGVNVLITLERSEGNG